MVKYIKSGTSYNYKIEFKVDGEFVSPSSANITLSNNAGSIIGGINNQSLTIPSGATSVTFTFSSGNNTRTLPYELRYISVSFVYNSKTYYINTFYTLRDSLIVPVTEEDVRNYIGVSSTELSDNQIDIYSAYDEVQTDVTANTLDTLVSSGSLLIPYVQLAVKARAALSSLIMIETVMFQSEQADNTLYKRFSSVDFNDILARVKDDYTRAILKLNEVASGEGTNVPLFLISTGTDPITNE